MKIFNSFFQVTFSIILIILSIYYLTAYRSAFEADQFCHSYISAEVNAINYKCDHDIETHQWILYQEQFDNKPAIVIKRFRYKFL